MTWTRRQLVRTRTCGSLPADDHFRQFLLLQRSCNLGALLRNHTGEGAVGHGSERNDAAGWRCAIGRTGVQLRGSSRDQAIWALAAGVLGLKFLGCRGSWTRGSWAERMSEGLSTWLWKHTGISTTHRFESRIYEWVDMMQASNRVLQVKKHSATIGAAVRGRVPFQQNSSPYGYNRSDNMGSMQFKRESPTLAAFTRPVPYLKPRGLRLEAQVEHLQIPQPVDNAWASSIAYST